jgi:hypothetical protein
MLLTALTYLRMIIHHIFMQPLDVIETNSELRMLDSESTVKCITVQLNKYDIYNICVAVDVILAEQRLLC